MVEIEKLKTFGLSQKEAQLYKYLLEQGSSSATAIGNAIKMGRTNVYEYAKSLELKGLVNVIEKQKKIFFQAQSPVKLKELGERIIQGSKDIEGLIYDYLPKLENEFLKQQNLPQISYLSGTKGYIELFDQIYLKGSHKELFLLISNLDNYEPCEPKYLFAIEQKQLSTNLFVNTGNDLEQFKKHDEKEHRKTIKTTMPIHQDMIVFEDRIVIGNISKGQFNVVVIRNYEFAEMFKYLLRSTSV